MRLLLAGLFVFLGFSLIPLVLTLILGEHGSLPLWTIALIAVGYLAFLSVGYFLFNPPEVFIRTFMSQERAMAFLEKRGLVVTEHFNAKKAFAVEPPSEEEIHYIVELADGRVLHLGGQFLYDFEPIDDDPAVNQARRFPCSTFTIKRHRRTQVVLAMTCDGHPFDPEFTSTKAIRRILTLSQCQKECAVLPRRSYQMLLDKMKEDEQSPA